jgi:acyl dehydratase
MTAGVRFEDTSVGDTLPERSNAVDRAQLVVYAGASGDFNPIHWNEEFAKQVGLPGVISHGMFSMALVGRMLSDWVGDPAAVKRFSVQFRDVVLPGETLIAKGRVAEKDEGARTATIELWAEVTRNDETVLPIQKGSAVVELA